MEPILIAALIILALIILILVIIIVTKKRKNENNNSDSAEVLYKTEIPEQKNPAYSYLSKQKYLTNNEIKFGKAIKQIIGDNYILYPQVHLSRIIEKQPPSYYQNELNRIVDFCVFSEEYKPLVCIEINDETHHQKDRKIRDIKVKEILDSAKLPLITFWVNYGTNIEYMKKRLSEFINIKD